MSGPPFEIVVADYSSSMEEWQRAYSAPKSELPELTAEQKETARSFKISEEEYARGVLAGLYGQERMKHRARRLGDHVQSILDEWGSGDRVVAVIYDTDKLRWILGIQTAGGTSHVAFPRELADDIIDWGLREQLKELKARLVQGLGREVASKNK